MTSLRYLFGQLRLMRADCVEYPAPTDAAEPKEHVRFLAARLLAVLLSGWFWLLVLVVAGLSWWIDPR